MQSLKKKFGKFAVSTEIASKVSGGHMALDPWCDDCGGAGVVFDCIDNRGTKFTTSSVQSAGNWVTEHESTNGTCNSRNPTS